MTRTRKRIVLVIMLLAMPLAFILTFNGMTHNFESLPYFGEFEVDASQPNDTLWKPIPNIELQDETGRLFSTDELKGNVYLVGFYSTSSPQLSKITERLLSVYFKYRSEEDIWILSISPNEAFDTAQRRQAYLTEVGTKKDKWKFLAGEKKAIESLATDVFDIDLKRGGAVLCLVDDKGFIRGRFNANLEKEINRAIESIAMMKKEIDLRDYDKEKMR